jgi:hypothetical protein
MLPYGSQNFLVGTPTIALVTDATTPSAERPCDTRMNIPCGLVFRLDSTTNELEFASMAEKHGCPVIVIRDRGK